MTFNARKIYHTPKQLKLAGAPKENLIHTQKEIKYKRMIGFSKAKKLTDIGKFEEITINLNDKTIATEEEQEEILTQKLFIDDLEVNDLKYFIDYL